MSGKGSKKTMNLRSDDDAESVDTEERLGEERESITSETTVYSDSGVPASGSSRVSNDETVITLMAKMLEESRIERRQLMEKADRDEKRRREAEDRRIAREEQSRIDAEIRRKEEAKERRDREEANRKAEEKEKRDREEANRKAEDDRMKAQWELFEKLRMEEAERLKLQSAAHQTWKEEQNKLKRAESKISMALRTFPKISNPSLLPVQLKSYSTLMNKLEASDAIQRERLPEVLSGVAASTYHNLGQREFKSFAELTKAFLEAAGVTFSNASRTLMKPDLDSLKKLSAADLLCHVKSTAERLLSGATGVEEAVSAICVMFLNTFGTDVVGLGIARCDPLCFEEVSSAVYTAYEASGSVLGTSGFTQRRPDARRDRPKCDHCGKSGHKSNDCWSKPKQKGMTCYVCRKEGHISTNCPEKTEESNTGGNKTSTINDNKKVWKKTSVVTETVELEEEPDDHMLQVSIGGQKIRVLLDSGAQVSVVPPSCVREGDYTGKNTCLTDFEGREVGRRRVAKVNVEVGDASFSERVAVSSHLGDEGILRLPLTDIKMLAVVMSEFSRQRTETVSAVQTRAETREMEQTAEQERQTLEEEQISISESPLEEGPVSGECPGELGDTASLLPESKDPGEVHENSAYSEPSCEIDWGCLRGGEEREELVQLTQDDLTLKEWKKLASKRERGYYWDKGILCHKFMNELGEVVTRIVVPTQKRGFLCRLAHERMGHLGHRKMKAVMSSKFTWPRIGSDLERHVASCEACQKAGKRGQSKAPMVERPILSEPFEAMAVDIVGPFPLARGKFRYLLTTCCLATRWPDVVALKAVTAKAVAEGLLHIFGRCGLPYLLLADNGSQFAGKLMGELTKLLGVEIRHSTPYHPEGNGLLERMHSTLVAMIRKAIDRDLDWAEQVPFALFALRQMPCRTTGLSPYELVWGREMRTPLDIVYHGWLEKVSNGLIVSEWVEKLAEKIEVMRDVAVSKASIESEYRKSYYDRGKSDRSYQVGDKVWLRLAGKASKLEDSWEGPFTVDRKLSEVNYSIKKEGSKKGRHVHVNLLKTYVKRESVNGITVLAEEEENVVGSSVNLGEEVLEDVLSQVENVLSEFGDLLDGSVGEFKGEPLSFEVIEGAVPVSSKPYRVPDAIKPKVKEALDSLIARGWVVEASSPWASPIVPVSKPDGTIRLCVNYKKLNEVTHQRQFPIPHFEDILGEVGQAVVLSKMDLMKGYHQVPLHPSCQDLTGFVTPWGSYKYTVLPFGLKNAPAEFQQLMCTVLKGCKSCAVVYIDDVLVFSDNPDEHAGHVRSVLSAIRKSGLKLNPSKCQWARTKMEFLGHVVGGGCVSVPEARVKALRDFKKPVSRRDMRAALGTFGYYRKFVPEYANITTSLSQATSSTAPRKVVWTPEMDNAFCELRNVISDVCCLFVPKCGDVFVLHTDASGRGVGAVLYVVRDEEELPVAFYSRQLRGAECRYSATELEALAVVASIEHFIPYLYGRRFEVVTDHAPLVSLMTSPTLNRRLRGFMLRLMEFDLSISYRPGALNADADGLSRQPWDVPAKEKLMDVVLAEPDRQSVPDRTFSSGRSGVSPVTPILVGGDVGTPTQQRKEEAAPPPGGAAR